tara:strand:- start:304 stop:1086 length:783 start_codon:yes stop_codon:yes gene_type:complete
MKIIYIAGYGRSGSTILDIILSNQSSVIGLGEFTNIFYHLTTLEDNDEVWLDLKDHLGKSDLELIELDQIRKKSEAIFFGLFYRYLRKSNYEKYTQSIRTIFEYLQSHYKEKVFIDSSKTAWMQFNRPNILKRLFTDVYVIQLERNFLDILMSLKKGDNIKMEKNEKNVRITLPILKLIIGRVVSYIFMLRNYSSEKYLLLSFQDLIDDPIHEIKRISRLVGHSFNESEQKILNNDSLSISLQFSGNRARNEKKIFFQRK